MNILVPTVRFAIVAWLVVVAGFVGPMRAFSAPAGSEVFADGSLLRLRIDIAAPDLDSLRKEPRTYVRATLTLGTAVLRDVGVHLKGRTGSFRTLDDKPAFTLDFDRFVPGQRFHSLSQVHLNNSVEDPSYLHEKLGAALFNSAGVPAPRVSHAVVDLNGRRLGLYVLKEGFAPEFFAQHFSRTDGNLFEPELGLGADVNGPMRRASGTGVADASDLRRLADAAVLPDVSARWNAFAGVLDRERFVSFVVMELLSGHRDGYCFAKNNFRIYHDPATSRFVFLPAGMDQLFGRAEFPLRPRMTGLIAHTVLETSEGRLAFRDRLAELFTNSFRVVALTNQVRRWAGGLIPHFSRAEARVLWRESEQLCQRIERRVLEVTRQLALPEPAPLEFTDDSARLIDWRAANPPQGGKLDQVSVDGRACLHIQAGPKTSAFWRTKVWLAPGRYRFEARARAAGVKPLPLARVAGVYLSVPGHDGQGGVPLLEDRDWTLLKVEFDLAQEEREVELQCNLRARAGEAWFESDSLRLVRVVPR